MGKKLSQGFLFSSFYSELRKSIKSEVEEPPSSLGFEFTLASLPLNRVRVEHVRNCGKPFSQLFNRKSLKFSQTVSCWSPCLTSKAAFILSSFNSVLKTIVSEAESVMGGIIVDYFQVLADFKILLNCQKPLALFYQFVFGNSMIRRAYYSCLQYRTKINPCVLTHQRRRVWKQINSQQVRGISNNLASLFNGSSWGTSRGYNDFIYCV